MIGIDFGTTNSCVAVRGAFGEVEPVAVATGPSPPYDTVLRTAVLNPQRQTAPFGQDAINRARQRLTENDRYLEAFKPYLDEQKLRTWMPVKVSVGYVYDPLLKSELEQTATQTLWVGGKYTRDELVRGSAHIFSHLLAAGDARRRRAGSDLAWYARQLLELRAKAAHMWTRAGLGRAMVGRFSRATPMC